MIQATVKKVGIQMTRTIDPDSFLSGSNAPYILDQFHQYCNDPSSVSEDWRAFFAQLTHAEKLEFFQDDRAPIWSQRSLHPQPGSKANGITAEIKTLPSEAAEETLRNSIRALMMIRAYRVRGHLNATLDPLALEMPKDHPELNPKGYGFTQEDMNKRVFVDNVLGLENPTVGEIYDKIKETYCQTIGIEFMHIQDPGQKSWIQERIENTPLSERVSDKERLEILKNVIAADSFERFLDTKYPGVKRFGIEGGESLIPSLEALVEQLGRAGVEKIVFGTAHRGRLNILANVIKKPLEQIFAHFQGGDIDPTSVHGTGDVKYHLGYSSVRKINGKDISLSLIPNPSHLEAVDPVVLGKVRADQDIIEDSMRRRVAAVMLHGDAAFAGQGLVSEVLDLSGLQGYHAGGTIHIIINNQIGFTTSPPHSRTSPYSSDVAKAIQAPIFHVNGDDPEAVVWITKLAVDYCRTFCTDVVIDLVCYRRFGHNEIDEPSFTQPLMYKKIKEHPSTMTIYAQKIVQMNLLSQNQVDQMVQEYQGALRSEFDSLTEGKALSLLSSIQWLEGVWKGLKAQAENFISEVSPNTGVEKETLRKIGKSLVTIPDNLIINNRLIRILKAKEQTLQQEAKIDWGTGEALAIGSLLLEGKRVRLSGQDVSRGTFSHRHGVWVDQQTEEKYVPLNHITSSQALFEVVDSPLAEASVLGFEYGYSLAAPHALVIWEAQFGDFANGAQVIIDQFISSGEHKWHRLSGLVMLLPHGHEGQGPEHTSARIERYLELCAQNNLRVINCTTPANYFHALRRQLRSETRKPLIVFSPKTLLRHPLAVSKFEDMVNGTSFQPVLNDESLTAQQKQKKEGKNNSIKRVILCSGKIYYELYENREEQKLKDIAIIRLEQYYPFPHQHLMDALKPYAHAQFIWCQEEPENMGAWRFLDRRLESVLHEIGAKERRFKYIGRPEAASPATGNIRRHEAEQNLVIQQALG